MSALPQPAYFDASTPPHISTLILLPAVGALGMSVFLPSLPAMAAYFDTDYAVVALAVSLYLYGTAFLQLLVGPLSDRFGRRPVMLISLALFLLATLVCIFAPTVEVFLVGRVMQAVSVSGMVLARAIVRDMVPAEKAASTIGYVTMGMAIVPLIGPAMGGALQEVAGWQSSFWLLFGFAAVVLAVSWRDLGETNRSTFVSFRAQLADYPELFRSRRFWGYCLAAAFSAGSFFAYLGGAPRVGTDVYALSPSAIGIYLAAPAVGYITGNYVSGRYSEAIGINRMILIGCALTGSGLATSVVLLSSGVDHPLAFFGFVTFVGLGNGMVLPSALAGTMSVRPHLAGTASGLGGSLMTGGGATLSILAGRSFDWGPGAVPLTALMLSTCVCALIAIFYTMRREQAVS